MSAEVTAAHKLAGLLILFACGVLVGFMTGRELPRQSLLEKECSAWAERTLIEMRDASRSSFGLLLGACMRGQR
jgi:hypothetical protein